MQKEKKNTNGGNVKVDIKDELEKIRGITNVLSCIGQMDITLSGNDFIDCALSTVNASLETISFNIERLLDQYEEVSA